MRDRQHLRFITSSPASSAAASPEEHRLVRQQKSRPLADAFEAWLRAKQALISQKIKLADAIPYALSRWQGLTRFTEDGRIELDNNTVERAVCRLISDGGAEHWAVTASLIETCLCRARHNEERF